MLWLMHGKVLIKNKVNFNAAYFRSGGRDHELQQYLLYIKICLTEHIFYQLNSSKFHFITESICSKILLYLRRLKIRCYFKEKE